MTGSLNFAVVATKQCSSVTIKVKRLPTMLFFFLDDVKELVPKSVNIFKYHVNLEIIMRIVGEKGSFHSGLLDLI